MLRNWVMLCSSSTTRIFSAGMSSPRCRRERGVRSGGQHRRGHGSGQGDARARALARAALERERAAVALDDALGDGQTETGAPLFGREERLSDPRKILRRYAGAVVDEIHRDL